MLLYAELLKQPLPKNEASFGKTGIEKTIQFFSSVLSSPLLCKKSSALAMSCTTMLASCSLKCLLLWMWVKTEPRGKKNKNIHVLKHVRSTYWFSYIKLFLALHNLKYLHCIHVITVCYKAILSQKKVMERDQLTSPQLLKHQVKLILLLKKLYKLQNVSAGSQTEGQVLDFRFRQNK